MKRKLRKAIEIGFPIVGMFVMFGSIVFVPRGSIQIQVLVMLLGVLILEAGVWGLTAGILPDERSYPALRKEGDHFIGLIRVLNQAAVGRDDGVAGASERFDVAVNLMQASILRMASVAGQECAVVEPDDAAPPTTPSTKTGSHGI